MNLTISSLKSFKDRRGEFVELWHDDGFPKFVEDDVSVSRRGVLRGLHGDGRTWKLVTCLQGEVFFAAVDPVTRAHEELVLSERNRLSVLVPPDRAVGYLVLSGRAVVHYKQSLRYGEAPQFTIRWNDSRFGIRWPIDDPVLSKRDAGA
jgi:dTDP-4-dehydrorhamnose 3,5-epimerase